MFPAFLATLFFAVAVIFASRSARQVGSATANFARMSFALLLLAAWAHFFGQGLAGRSFSYFFVSGCVGFGFGDIALYLALPRIGPRLTILLVQCLAAPIATLTERVWLGTTMLASELICGAIILIGVGIALAPEPHLNVSRRDLWVGVTFGCIAAVGQAMGAVISRKAFQIAAFNQFHIDGLSAAYQRMLGGIIISAAFLAIVKIWHWNRSLGIEEPEIKNLTRTRGPLWRNIALNGFFGPVIGVGCYQWALSSAPSGIVLPIVALTPVVTIPLAYFIEGDRPHRRSVIGGLVAVAGAVALKRIA